MRDAADYQYACYQTLGERHPTLLAHIRQRISSRGSEQDVLLSCVPLISSATDDTTVLSTIVPAAVAYMIACRARGEQF